MHPPGALTRTAVKGRRSGSAYPPPACPDGTLSPLFGSGGISGSNPSAVELLTAVAALGDLPPFESDDPVVPRTTAREYRLLTKRAVELTVARAVGVVVEIEAVRLGWRPEVEQ